MNKIIVIGAGGHSKSCIDVIEEQGKFKIAGLICNDDKYKNGIGSYGIIGKDKDLKIIREKYDKSLVAVGQIKTSENRKKIYELLKNLNFKLPKIISPRAYVSKNAEIGEGTIIMHGAVVNAGAVIGNNCIINSKALIEHDSIVGNHCHISTGALLNGGVTVGENTFVGSGVVVKELIKIESNCIIGAGSTIVKNVKKNSTTIIRQ